MKVQMMILALTLMSSLNVFAAPGSSEPPLGNTDLVEARGEEIAEIMSSFYDTQKFVLRTKVNGKIEKQEVHIVLASRYEPDAPVNQNLFILKTTDYPGVFNTGAITIQAIKKIADDTLEMKGSGGHWFGWDECEGKFVAIQRTIQIKLKVETMNGYDRVKPVFEKVIDVQGCR